MIAFYRIEEGDVVFRMGEVTPEGWTECSLNAQGEYNLGPEAAEIQRQKNEIASSTQYITERANAYPSLEEQADMAYWDKVNGTNVLYDAISAVKAAYPKPTGGS